jgi:hypothetical protein
MTFDDMTDDQLVRLYVRSWERMTQGDGYQPFGYDSRTLWLTRPSWMRHIDAIRAEVHRRIDAGIFSYRYLGRPT